MAQSPEQSGIFHLQNPGQVVLNYTETQIVAFRNMQTVAARNTALDNARTYKPDSRAVENAPILSPKE